MQLNLNFWKVILLTTPFILASLLMGWGDAPGNLCKVPLEIANYLLIIDILILCTTQAIILIGFMKAADRNDIYFKINAIIPVIFLTVYLLYVIGSSITRPYVNSDFHPLKKADLQGNALIIFLFLVHAAINFLFTNNNYVKWELNKMTDTEKQLDLKINYFKPMRLLVRTSVWVVVGCLLVSTIVDLAAFF
jgi:hypothetical protein